MQTNYYVLVGNSVSLRYDVEKGGRHEGDFRLRKSTSTSAIVIIVVMVVVLVVVGW